jgi:hypothetical protein
MIGKADGAEVATGMRDYEDERGENGARRGPKSEWETYREPRDANFNLWGALEGDMKAVVRLAQALVMGGSSGQGVEFSTLKSCTLRKSSQPGPRPKTV